MSTVALRGKLELVETKEIIEVPSREDEKTIDDGNASKTIKGVDEENNATSIKITTENLSGTGTKARTVTRKVRKWVWKGKWAFGSYIDASFINSGMTTPLPKSSPKVQPFHYCFEEAADPAKVSVHPPSIPLSAPTPLTSEMENTLKQEDASKAKTNTHTARRIGEEEVSAKGVECITPIPQSTDSTCKKTEIINNGATAVPENGSNLENKRNSYTKQNFEKEKEKPSDSRDSNTKQVHASSTSSLETDELGKGSTHSGQTVKATEREDRKTLKRESTPKQPERQTAILKKPDAEQGPNKEDSTTNGTNEIFLGDSQALTSDLNHKVPTGKENKHLDLALSFAGVSAGVHPFTEALSYYRQKGIGDSLDIENTNKQKETSSDCVENPCPPSGLWKGYFQNATAGRGKGTQRVQEKFYLFLNARPGKNVPFSFDGVQNQMPPLSVTDPILVRGRGENQFGLFEISGYLDIATMEMEIQRQYVYVEEETVTNVSPSKRKKQRSSTPAVTRHKSSRPYFTRKRQPSWKVKSQEESKEEEPHKRKKRKISVDVSSGRTEGHSKVGTTPVSTTSTVSMGSGPELIRSSAGSPPANVGVGKTPLKRKLSANVDSARKRGSTGGSIKASPKAITGSLASNAMKLPPTGNPQKAKWRAAHFLYYQRHDPEEQQSKQQQQHHMSKQTKQKQQQPSTGCSSASVSTNPKYVIYEGEMVESKREGRGICLYSNNMLYEGNWKRNKEHGYGKLMTSDRARIIYEGEFERGRMQGRGTYYYEQAENLRDGVKGARYIGEFKENMRNGLGKYYLPDKSVYDGMWSNGLMNGRGTYTWADSSFYDGEWKDGKRNGQGILKTLDGFYYDGMWVNNAMEGRGFAVYPNGQKYEGLFSRGRREGRGTLTLTNGVVYEGRFRDDAVDGQGTMKMMRSTLVPRKEGKDDFMIPISFQSDMSHIHTKAGFTSVGD